MLFKNFDHANASFGGNVLYNPLYNTITIQLGGQACEKNWDHFRQESGETFPTYCDSVNCPRLPGCIANTTLRWAGFTPAEARMLKVSSAARRASVAENEETWSHRHASKVEMVKPSSGRFWFANTESFWKALPKFSLYPGLPDFIVHCILDFIPSITCRHQVQQQDINI